METTGSFNALAHNLPASPIAQSWTAHSMFVRILTTVSWPNSPFFLSGKVCAREDPGRV